MTHMNIVAGEQNTGPLVHEQGRRGVRLVRRNTSLVEPIQLPFSVKIGEMTFKGQSFNLEEFEVAPDPDVATPEGEFPFAEGALVEVTLRVDLHGFTMELPADAEVVSDPERTGEGPIRFAFRDMTDHSNAVLQSLARSYFAGHIADLDDLVVPQDPETEIKSGAKEAVPTKRGLGKAVANFTTVAIAVAAIAGSVVFVGNAVFQRFFLIDAQVATVTAPSLEIISPATGQIDTPIAFAGQIVQRDDPLFQVQVVELEAEEAVLSARVSYLSSNLDAVESNAAFANAESVEISGFGFEELSIATREDLRRVLSFTEGELRAVQLRLAALRAFAPCDCMVTWYQEDAAWVREGDPVVVLARTDSDALRVEALVHAAAIEDIHIGQEASVTDPATGEEIVGQIERITVDPRQQPRVGFPQWLRQEPTLASVIISTERPAQADQIGQPMQVQFWRYDVPAWSDVAASIGLHYVFASGDSIQ